MSSKTLPTPSENISTFSYPIRFFISIVTLFALILSRLFSFFQRFVMKYTILVMKKIICLICPLSGTMLYK